jgi:hypothetical protein
MSPYSAGISSFVSLNPGNTSVRTQYIRQEEWCQTRTPPHQILKTKQISVQFSPPYYYIVKKEEIEFT